MQIKVYVNYIFPATCEVDDATGGIDAPHMTNNILNSEWMLWLFDFIAWLLAWAWEREGLDPMFECRIAKKDKIKLHKRWPYLYDFKK